MTRRRPDRLIVVVSIVALMVGVALAAGLLSVASSGAPVRVRAQPEVPATAMNLASRVANNSPELAADPTEPERLVLANRLDGPEFSCAMQISGDGGRHWITDTPVTILPKGVERCYAPEAAFDRDGHLYYLFVGLAGKGNSPVGVYLTTSEDGANTFSPPRQILGGERYMVRMTLDPELGDHGRIHLVWLEAREHAGAGFPPTPNPIMASFSDDAGRTFSTPQQVSDPARQRVVAPAVAVGPDHAVHVLYYDLGEDARDYEGLEGPRWDGEWSLVVSTSTDAGAHYGQSAVVDGHVVPPERVMLIQTMPPASIVTDPRGRVMVAWHDARNGDWDVFLRRSADNGQGWSPALRLNDDPIHDGRNQYLPRLSVASDGRIDAIFYDRRNNVENRGNDVYYTYSTDGGDRFSTNVKLTSIDSDSHVGPRYAVPSARGLVEFGSRLGLVSEPSHVVAAWTDTRNTARGITAQDIFATQIDLQSSSSTAGWVLVMGGVVALIGLVGVGIRLERGRRGAGRPRRLTGTA